MYFTGSGVIDWNNGTVNNARFGFTTGASGTVNINGGSITSSVGVLNNISGTEMVVTANNVFGDSTALTLQLGAIDFSGRTETMGQLNTNNSATLTLNGSTDLTFTNLSKTVNGDINILGWVEGGSSILFTDLTFSPTAGDIINGISIGGSDAFWQASSGDWVVSAVPEPGTFVLAIFGLVALLALRRRRQVAQS
jgi:hypothetical protein